MQQNPRARKFKLGKMDERRLAQIPCRTGLGLSSSAEARMSNHPLRSAKREQPIQ
jgi:hypothetical protein